MSNTVNKDKKTIQIGLTGSIGMGKSTITKQFQQLGFRVFDADEEVHRLYSRGGEAIEPLRELFPQIVVNGSVDRPQLMHLIMNDSTVLKRVEDIVHPLVAASRQRFHHDAESDGEFLVVYDIPLLFENRGQYNVDYVVVVTASAEVQRQRVLARSGMTVEKFESILKKQVPDDYKRQHADFLIHSDYPGFAEGKAQVASAIEKIIQQNPVKWQSWLNRSLGIDKVKSVKVAQSYPHRIRQAIDMVVFDLDDTLVPTMKQISIAIKALRDYMAKRMPESNKVSSTEMRELMLQVNEDNPLLQHDLTEIRRKTLHRIASRYGEDEHVDEAMEVFVKVRSDVTSHLYGDVIACFDWLQALDIKIAIFTNGAAEVGAAKPSPVGFLVCAQKTGLLPSRILFVGDSYDKDVVGSKNCGMHSALLRRESVANPSSSGDLSAADIILDTLSPREFEQKMLAHLDNVTRK